MAVCGIALCRLVRVVFGTSKPRPLTCSSRSVAASPERGPGRAAAVARAAAVVVAGATIVDEVALTRRLVQLQGALRAQRLTVNVQSQHAQASRQAVRQRRPHRADAARHRIGRKEADCEVSQRRQRPQLCAHVVEAAEQALRAVAYQPAELPPWLGQRRGAALAVAAAHVLAAAATAAARCWQQQQVGHAPQLQAFQARAREAAAAHVTGAGCERQRGEEWPAGRHVLG
eukprot:360591-Chlamydomonas_euryale.AAC.5